MTKQRQSFARSGAVMLAPAAFSELFDDVPSLHVERREAVAIVPVRGPLEQHNHYWFDSYEAIIARVDRALAEKPKAIILSLATPGGVVAGAFETARSIRARCDAAGVELVAYVDGYATSAGYALAATCSRIIAPRSAIVGSIGTVCMATDVTAMDAAMGVKCHVITSGARKADGHPHVPMSPEALASLQAQCDALAEVFFGHVAQSRPGLPVDTLRALEAGMFTGQQALERGLIDSVATLDELVRSFSAAPAAIDPLVASRATGTAPMSAKDSTMTYEEAIAALRKVAEGEGEDAEEAKAALAAIDEGDEDEGDKPDEDTKPEDDKGKDEEAKATSARLARLEAAQVESMLASRPDIDGKLAATIRKLPLDAATAVIVATPRRASSASSAAASVTATGTRAEGQTSPAAPSASGNAEMAQVMGRHASTHTGTKRTASGVIFGLPKPAKPKAANVG